MSGHDRAWLLQTQGRYELAEKEWRRVLAADPDDAVAHACLGLCLCERKRWQEAGDEAERAIALAPDSGFPHYARARVMLVRDRHEQALASAVQAIRLDLENAEFRALHGAILGDLERWSEALDAADKGLALDPQNERCLNVRALALTHLGRKDEAARTIADALQQSPENSFTHANQGWALLHAGDPKTALTHFQEALRLDPDNDYARNGMVEALKARNPLYRPFLAYFLFMSRTGPRARWAIVIGIFMCNRAFLGLLEKHPEWGAFLWPLIALILMFVFGSWFAVPLTNLALCCSRYGRHALAADRKWQAALLACCLVSSAACFAYELAIDYGHMASLMLLLLALPVISVHRCPEGWPRRVAILVAAAFAFSAVAFAAVVFNGEALYRHGGELGKVAIVFAKRLSGIYPIGILVWTFGAQILANRTVEK
jgi:tetratricopeptide (TPR) repeat protein